MLPAGPTSHPIVQLIQWVRTPFPFLDTCRKAHGSTFTLRLAGFGESVFTDDPDLIHAVFTAPTDTLCAGKGNDVLLPFVGQHSVLTLDGAPHARDRKLMTPPFHGQRMRAYGHIIARATERAIASWQPGQTLPTQAAMQAISLEVILRAVMGVDDGDGLGAAQSAITDLLATVNGPMVFFEPLQRDFGRWSPGGKYQRQRARTDKLLNDAIALRKRSPGEDILSLLTAARDEDGHPLTDEELRGELVTLLLAGHETTANALAWALAWLSSQPGVTERLVAEIDSAPAEPEAISKLPWLGAVCNEVLRILPVFPIVMRVAVKPWSHGDLHLPAGARIAPCIYLTHRRPELYPDPEQFSPQRFLDRTFAPHEFIAFGGGSRRCLGQAFAMYEMKIVLATILRSVRLRTVAGPSPIADRRNLAMGPRGGAVVTVQERRPDHPFNNFR